MANDALDVLLLIFLLQLKHLVADFFLQNEYMLAGRDRYVHSGRVLHVVLHVIGTVAVLLVMRVGATGIALIAGLEFLLHYHIDWAKSALNHRRGMTPSHAGYWHALGVDQALHQATYLLIALLCLTL